MEEGLYAVSFKNKVVHLEPLSESCVFRQGTCAQGLKFNINISGIYTHSPDCFSPESWNEVTYVASPVVLCVGKSSNQIPDPA